MPIYDYTQPDTEKPVINLADFLRIHQYSASQGDIWQSNVGGNAFAIGPDSDFSSYQLVYRDEAVPQTFLNQIAITPDAPFVGTVQARNDKAGSYMPSNRKGVLYLYPTQSFDKNYLPSAYGVGDTLVFEYPIVDIIQFFSAPQQIATARADKTYFYQQMPFGADDAFLLVPCYGRKTMSVRITNRTGVAQEITISGITWTLGDFSAGENATVTPIATVAALADNATNLTAINTATSGVFDYLQIQFNPSAPVTASDIPIRITMSDDL